MRYNLKICDVQSLEFGMIEGRFLIFTAHIQKSSQRTQPYYDSEKRGKFSGFIINNIKNVFLIKGEKYLNHQLPNISFLKESGKIQI